MVNKYKGSIKRKRENKKKLQQFRDSRKCQDCGSKKGLTLHHIIPKSVGGQNIKTNCVILCRKCHNLEHSKNHKEKWSNEDIDLIILLRKQGYNYDDISGFLGRSISSCTTMVHNIKLGVDNLSNELRTPLIRKR